MEKAEPPRPSLSPEGQCCRKRGLQEHKSQARPSEARPLTNTTRQGPPGQAQSLGWNLAVARKDDAGWGGGGVEQGWGDSQSWRQQSQMSSSAWWGREGGDWLPTA